MSHIYNSNKKFTLKDMIYKYKDMIYKYKLIIIIIIIILKKRRCAVYILSIVFKN